MVVPLKPSEHLSRPLILGVAGKNGREGLIQMLDATCFDKRYFITVVRMGISPVDLDLASLDRGETEWLTSRCMCGPCCRYT